MKTGIVIALGLLTGLPSIGSAEAAAPANVEVRQKAPFGDFLADGNGRALYMFTADQGPTSACYNACAGAWPAFTSAGKPVAGSGVAASMLGLTARKDGTQQVTYDGKPLYYFAGDSGAGSTAGEDVDHFGGSWYLVSPKGAKIEPEDAEKGSASKW